MMRTIFQQLRKGWSFSTPYWREPLLAGPVITKSARRRPRRPQPRLEELETRLAPSVDLLSNAAAPDATPDVYLLQSSAASPSVTPGALPAGFSPQQISQAYGFNQITFKNGTIQGNGSGQTIAIVDAYSQPNIASDLQTFDSTYGIAAPPSFTVVNENGGSTLPTSDTNWGMEESLDVEWAHAMAPGANILLVEANSNSYSDLLTAVNYARNQPGVSVVSMSWGGPEFAGENLYDSYFTTPTGHNGVTFVASSGDNGSSGAPEFVSVSPNVLAVGGTQLSTDTNGNYLSETGWSGSGGGISAYESQPSYQQGVVTQTSTMRAVPDVAYNASDGSPYAVYDTDYGGWIEVYGTSAGAPQWSALVAIADQGRALNNQSTLDGATQTLPAIYQLPSSDFHDITSGSNGSYSAGPGYDLVTGLGSPLANQVAAGLVSYGTTTTAQGPWVVNAASATPSPVTGTTTSLSVLGDDSAGASSLTYTWSVLSAPTGVQAPTFSVNASNAAQNTVATFYAAGTYTFEATITDTSGLSTTSDVTVTVNQTLTSVTVSPGSVTLSDGNTQQFSASGKDQFGHAMSTQPAFTWTITSGAGTLNNTGLYTTPTSGSGTATVQATAGGLSATASITYDSAPAAPSNLTATVISTHQVNLAWTDNATNANGVVVQRSTDGTNWTTLATLAGTAASYSDTSVSKGKTYYYRVYADNSFGNSAYSNTATATTSSSKGGGGGGNHTGTKTAGQTNAAAADPSPFFTIANLEQQTLDLIWADLNYVNSLWSSVAQLAGQVQSTLSHAFLLTGGIPQR
jgi:subtilase family serine protease